ncbi:hypothetical protein N8996_01870 [Candidatus Poseidonia alphae]|nr:hypothetical protein [Candidatus Poseidonia alphae]
MSKSNNETDVVPEDFPKLVYDLINDILYTFPEYKNNLDANLNNIKETQDSDSIKEVYDHFKKVLPERFFDILYKNEEMFQKEEINTEFLPGIDFKKLWTEDISNTTKDTIWKYLQLILFTVIGKVDSQESFGDTAKLFEAINEGDLKDKLEETMANLQNMMDNKEDIIDVSGIDMENLPRPDEINDHINGLLNGKLGNLAKEIAEETAESLNLDTENASSVNDVFQSLFKNPGKLMNLVKNVGGKLDDKIKSGEIKESEIMQEASDLLSKMKDMPGMAGMGGMGDIQSMMRQMGMNLGRGQKMNLGAMQGKLDQTMKVAKMKERIRQKSLEKQNQQIIQSNIPDRPPMTDAEIEELVFSIEGDKPEKTQRNQGNNNINNKKKKKKGKKK